MTEKEKIPFRNMTLDIGRNLPIKKDWPFDKETSPQKNKDKTETDPT